MSDIDVLHGDCIELLPSLDAESFDACVCDPPYHLTAGKRGGSGEASVNLASPAGRSRVTTGFMGQKWDGGDVAFRPETWREVLRVLKPGAHLLAFSGTRTYHRMVSSIEDAGFEVRDQLAWVYGSGFPKSHDISKAIDKMFGVEREIVGSKIGIPGYSLAASKGKNIYGGGIGGAGCPEAECAITKPSTDAAKQWEGWGTALKPAWEPIVLARKPLAEKTIAAQVLSTGTGAINIDACRVACEPIKTHRNTALGRMNDDAWKAKPGMTFENHALGRWPANLAHDGSEEVLAAFPPAPGQQRPVIGDELSAPGYGGYARNVPAMPRGDSGSAARFFYCAKASAKDRMGSKHPTVKPIALMRWLCRMVTPPGGRVLDPFAGTGTTGAACIAEGFAATLIEREAEYINDIHRRLEHAQGDDLPLGLPAQMPLFGDPA